MLLKGENADAVVLGSLSEVIMARKQNLSNSFGDGVECEIHDPVKHFNQERELLEDSTVPIVGESRRVGGSDVEAAAIPLLCWILCGSTQGVVDLC